jgi:hypothetical protein
MQGLLLQIRSLWEILIKSKTILEELDWDAQSRLTGLRWTTLVWERVKEPLQKASVNDRGMMRLGAGWCAGLGE